MITAGYFPGVTFQHDGRGFPFTEPERDRSRLFLSKILTH